MYVHWGEVGGGCKSGGGVGNGLKEVEVESSR